MLDDRERAALSEIERTLGEQAPELAAKLEGATRPAADRHQALVIAVVLLGGAALVLGHPMGILVFALLAGWAWARSQYRRKPGA
ncbi:DUF3040 domain-containing protein [Lentzea sp. NPDC042327]|uniref:DUF3040 domain-containing protein n=1 Tax=Lentzea sp. NPDC042327 TaxID=3154801 RepID=UPI0034085C0E